LGWLYLKQLVESLIAQPVALVYLPLLQGLDALHEFLLLDPAIDLLTALLADESSNDAPDQSTDYWDGDEHLASNCPEYGRANSSCRI
jgi:hypothetical protein